MSTRTVIWTIWACVILRAGFHASVTPLWEGYDEYSHFATIQHVALYGNLPDSTTANSSAQVLRSLQLTPVPRTIRNYAAGLTTHDEYWKLPEAERSQRQRELRELAGNDLAARPAVPPLPMYEAQQAPLSANAGDSRGRSGNARPAELKRFFSRGVPSWFADKLRRQPGGTACGFHGRP